MRRRQAVTGWLLAAPAVVGLLAFLVLPFCYTVFRSFTSGLGWGQFVGLENYSLTEKGKSLIPMLTDLCTWGEEHRNKPSV